MKNYASWLTDQLRKEERELKLMGHNKVLNICEIDKVDNLEMIRRMQEKHAEWIAIHEELQSRTNGET